MEGRPLKAVVHINNSSHQAQHGAWVTAGLRKHGINVVQARWNSPTVADMVVVWGWKQERVIKPARERGIPILVMERAHLPPRMEWTSCGLNGLCGRATYAKANDGGARWREHFAHIEQPWKAPAIDGHVVVFGQVRGDASLWGVDFHKWAQDCTNSLKASGFKVVYRPHPLSVRLQNDLWCPRGATFSTGKAMADDLAGAAFAVTFNSTSGVETVLAGVPTVTFDQGAMAWPVTTHSLDDELIRPDRTAWAHDLAWTSWLPAEIENGTMWDHLRGQLPCAMAA
jgi:hypothetical protein